MSAPLTGSNVPTDEINKRVDSPKQGSNTMDSYDTDTLFQAYRTAVKKNSPVGINLGIPTSSLENVSKELIDEEGLKFSIGAGDLSYGVDMIQKGLSEKQGILSEVGNAIPQTAVKTLSGALAALGVGWEGIKSLSPSHDFGFKDNGLIEAAMGLDKMIEEAFPLHRDPTDNSMFTSENVVEGLTNLPGIATGAGLTSTGTRLITRGMFNSASKMFRAGLKNEVKQTALQAFKSTLTANPASKLAYGTEWGVTTLYQGASEGYMEGVQLYTETIDKLNEETTRDLIAGKINKDQYLRKLQENEDRANHGGMITFALGTALSTFMNAHWTRPGGGLFTNKLLGTAEDTFNANKRSWAKDLGIETGLESTEELLMAGITGGSEGLTSASMLNAPFSEQLNTFIRDGLENMASEEGAFGAFMGGFGGAMQKVVADGFNKLVFKESTGKYNMQVKNEINQIFKNNNEFKTITGMLATNELTKNVPKTSLDSINNLVANSVGNHTESYLRNAIKDAKKDLEQKAQDMQNPELAEQAKAQLENIGQVENQLFMAVRLRDGNYSLSNKVREINPDSMPSYIYDLLDKDNRKFDLERANDLVNTYKKEVNGEKKEGSKKSKTPQAEYNLLPLVKDETTLEELKTIGEKARALTQGSDTELKPTDIDVMINNDILTHSRNKNLGTNDPYQLLSIQSMDPFSNMENFRGQYNDALDKAEMEIDNTDMASIPGKDKLNVKDIVEAENNRAEQEKALAEQTRVISEKYTTKSLNNIQEKIKEIQQKEDNKKALEIVDSEKEEEVEEEVEEEIETPLTITPPITETLISGEVEDKKSLLKFPKEIIEKEEKIPIPEVKALIEKDDAIKEVKKAEEKKEISVTTDVVGIYETKDTYTDDTAIADVLINQETLFSRRLSSSDSSQEIELTFTLYDGEGPLKLTSDKETKILDTAKVGFIDTISIYTPSGALIGYAKKDSDLYKSLIDNLRASKSKSLTLTTIVSGGSTKARYKSSGSPIRDFSVSAKKAFRNLVRLESKAVVLTENSGFIPILVGDSGKIEKSIKVDGTSYSAATLKAANVPKGTTVLITKSGPIALSTRLLDVTTLEKLYNSFGSKFTGDLKTQITDFFTAFTNINAESTDNSRSITVTESAGALNITVRDNKDGKAVNITVDNKDGFSLATLNSIFSNLKSQLPRIGLDLKTGLNYSLIDKKGIDVTEAMLESFNVSVDFIEDSTNEQAVYYKVREPMFIKVYKDSISDVKAEESVVEGTASVEGSFSDVDMFATAFSPVSENVVVPVEYEEYKDAPKIEGINTKEFNDSVTKHIAFFAKKLGLAGDRILGLINNLPLDYTDADLLNLSNKLNIQNANLEVFRHWVNTQLNNPARFVVNVEASIASMKSFYTKTAVSEDIEDSSIEVQDTAMVDSESDIDSIDIDDADYENTTDEAIKTKSYTQEWGKMDMEVQEALSSVPMVDKRKVPIRSGFGTIRILPPVKLIEGVIKAVNSSDPPVNSFTDFKDLVHTFKESDSPFLNSFYYFWRALEDKASSEPTIQMLQTKLYNHMDKPDTKFIIVENNLTTGSLSTRIKGVTERGTDFFKDIINGLIGVLKRGGNRKKFLETAKEAHMSLSPIINRFLQLESTRDLKTEEFIFNTAYKLLDRKAGDTKSDGSNYKFSDIMKKTLQVYFREVYKMDLDSEGLDVYLSTFRTGDNRKLGEKYLYEAVNKNLNAAAFDKLMDEKVKYEGKIRLYLDAGEAASEFAAGIAVLGGKAVSTPFMKIGGKAYYVFSEPRLVNEIVTDEEAWNKPTVAEIVGGVSTNTEQLKKVRKFKIQKLWGSVRRTKRKNKNSETPTYTPREEFVSSMTMLFGQYNNSNTPPLFTTPVISDTGDMLVFGGHMYLSPEGKEATLGTLYDILTDYAYREYLTVMEMSGKGDTALSGYSDQFALLFPDLLSIVFDSEFIKKSEEERLSAIKEGIKKSLGTKTRFPIWYEFLKNNNIVHQAEVGDKSEFGFTPILKNIVGFSENVPTYLSGLKTFTSGIFKSYTKESDFRTKLEESGFLEYYELLYLVNHLHYYEKMGMPHTMAAINKKTKVTDSQTTLSNLIKRAKSWVSPHTSARWLSDTFKVIVLKDEEMKFKMEETANSVVILSNPDGDIKVNTTDAQEYSTPLEFLESLVAYGHITEQEAFGVRYNDLIKTFEDLREENLLIGDEGQLFDSTGFLRESSLEDLGKYFTDGVEAFSNSRLASLHKLDAADSGTLMVPEKNVYCGPDTDYNLSSREDGLPGFRLVYLKSSTLPLIPANLGVTGEAGEFVPTEKHKLLSFMIKNGINRAAQESASKVGTRVNQVMDMATLESIDLQRTPEKVFTLDRKYYGRQQLTQAKPKSKITMGTQLMYLLFEGDVNGPNMEGLNAIRSQFIQGLNGLLDVKRNKFLLDFGLGFDEGGTLTVIDPNLFNNQLAKSLDNYNDKLTTDLRTNFRLGEDLEFSIPIDLVGNSEKLQESLASIVNKNLVRIKLPGTSCIQVSSNGFKMLVSDELKAPSYNKSNGGSIEAGDAIITWPFGKEAWALYNSDAAFKKHVDTQSTSIGFRIPTSGLPSSTYVNIKWLNPDEGPIAVLSPVTVHMLGADFDVDKLTLYVRPLYDMWKRDHGKLNPEKLGSVDAEQYLFEVQESTFTGIQVTSPGKLGSKVPIPIERFKAMMTPIGTESISAKIAKMKEQGIDSYYDDANPFGVLNVMNRRKVASESKILTGVFSVWVVAINKLQYYAKQTGGTLYTFIGNKVVLPTIDGIASLGDFPFIGDNSLKSASGYISECQNYALELAKDPNSDIPNINVYTSGIAGLMTSLGYDIETTINFIANPVIKEFVRRKALNNDSMTTGGGGAYSTRDFIDAINKEFSTKLVPFPYSDVPNIDSAKLQSTVASKDFLGLMKSDPQFVIQLLKAFDDYETIARKLIGEIRYTRQNSVGVPKNLYELIVWNRNYVQSTFAKLSREGILKDTFSSYQRAFSLLEGLYFGKSYYKELFFSDFLGLLTASGINVIDSMSSIRSFMLKSIVKTPQMQHLLGPGDLTEEVGIQYFNEYLNVAKEKYPHNRFLQSITVGLDTEEYIYNNTTKVLPKIEFILKDGEEDYQKSDVADALIQEFSLLLNDATELKLNEDDSNGVNLQSLLQNYIRYNYQVFGTSFRKGSILGLIPSAYTTLGREADFNSRYASSLDIINGMGTKALLKDFANQNKDMIIKVDVKKGNKIDKLNNLDLGGVVKDSKGEFFIVKSSSGDSYIVESIDAVAESSTWDKASLRTQLDSKAYSEEIKQFLSTLLDSLTEDIKTEINYNTSGKYFGSFNKARGVITIFQENINDKFKFSGAKTKDSIFLFTAIEELLHYKFSNIKNNTIRTDLSELLNSRIGKQAQNVLNAYGLLTVDGKLTEVQSEELLILMVRSFVGDPQLKGLLKKGVDLTDIISHHFDIKVEKYDNSALDTTPAFTTKEFVDNITDKPLTEDGNQPCGPI